MWKDACPLDADNGVIISLSEGGPLSYAGPTRPGLSPPLIKNALNKPKEANKQDVLQCIAQLKNTSKQGTMRVGAMIILTHRVQRLLHCLRELKVGDTECRIGTTWAEKMRLWWGAVDAKVVSITSMSVIAVR